ncbi:uncharacterized protein PV07_03112 [Cladophialophora immunda]|uniref:MmgE/PrpD family protein n=1 Tax=Cladophialophora immunda TaxID=569365 RepID=A0A0D2D6Z7_9EURO|nr:uncharacterized protein PV07_03112 [Cladophialophora immunda]KIW31464.1 hypothetical protein PV07_03112 [Cladophialophora immunda]
MSPGAATNATDFGPTKKVSQWIASVKLEDIPEDIRTRAKYLILDGLACGLMAAHLPTCEKAVNILAALEPAAGDAVLFGWAGKKVTPLTSALLNGTFIQGFELDDWHSEAPLHSNSIILPALLAAAQHLKMEKSVSGPEFLLATLVGFEVGPRVGRGLHGAHILSTGWHSGAVFGPSASAASVSKLFGLSAESVEDALGIACTQACGLMSAQFESEVKRMQHGFAARSGLMAAFLARGGYIGIKNVYEREYGGFLKQFSGGNGKSPQFLPEEVSKDLGIRWQTNSIRVKPYACVAAVHGAIDCVRFLQQRYPERFRANQIQDIKKIHIKSGPVNFHHGGWKAARPLTNTGAQMSATFAVATQIIHNQVLAAQFRNDMLENNDVWKLVDLSDCELAPEYPHGQHSMTIEFADGSSVSQLVENSRGVKPPLTNEEIVEKWRNLTKDIMDSEIVRKIEEIILSLDTLGDISPLYELLSTKTTNPIA